MTTHLLEVFYLTVRAMVLLSFYNHLFWLNHYISGVIDLTWHQEDVDVLNLLHQQGLDQGYLWKLKFLY
jgi:hypothetical protein